MTKVELLKEFAKGWFGNSQQHSIHAQLLKQRGFGKLGDKIMAESDEEWGRLRTKSAEAVLCMAGASRMPAGQTGIPRKGTQPEIACINQGFTFSGKEI